MKMIFVLGIILCIGLAKGKIIEMSLNESNNSDFAQMIHMGQNCGPESMPYGGIDKAVAVPFESECPLTPAGPMNKVMEMMMGGRSVSPRFAPVAMIIIQVEMKSFEIEPEFENSPFSSGAMGFSL